MFANYRYSRLLVLLSFLAAAGIADAQNELRNTFLKDADNAMAAADNANAKLLSPSNYERAAKAYETADESLTRGRNIEYVRDKAAEATRYYKEALEVAQLAKTALAQGLKSRQDAANARAPELSRDLWDKAQREFASAIRYLERGDLKRAQRYDIEATSLYRDAELVAIKAQYLDETRRLIADAERARVERYAPITLAKAKSLLAEAEKELNENRYDADRPRALAREANYEAKHAIYLSEVVRDVRDRDVTVEQVILKWEGPLREIASAADISADLSNGHEGAQAMLIEYIENMRNLNQGLEQERDQDRTRLSDMEEEIRALDERLGGATAERAALVQRLEAEARVREQFAQVEKMFGRDEARVLREGDNIILRLVGLTFDSGKSNLPPASFNLLAKVERAIDVFPQSELIIEGHTDSFGGDELNQRLSQERAESVKQYMVNAMRIPAYRLISVGYGETNPIANNETEGGRARNRRIDIVIKPNLDAMGSQATYNNQR
ncbi:MAG: OmpA family protein [Gammaproteobacteria bacterium]|nr:OmpA family protein [Gammaproteobacteria bacterium]MDH4255110.1 OmpA family protein [Gammaproteobacteria bacterium]MDH5310821.1 OmpA family protein [Gammaproteobacteria bacterium]